MGGKELSILSFELGSCPHPALIPTSQVAETAGDVNVSGRELGPLPKM
jgi:hypothetical protein